MTGRRLFIRSSLTLALPIVLVWAFTAELAKGLKTAVRFAWLEMLRNVESYHRLMENPEGD